MRLKQFLACVGPKPKGECEAPATNVRSRSKPGSADHDREQNGKRHRQRSSGNAPADDSKVAAEKSLSISLEDVAEADGQAVGHLARVGSRDKLSAKCLAPRRRTDTGEWVWMIPAAGEVLDMSGMESGDQIAFTLDTLLSPRRNLDGSYSFPGNLKKVVLQGTGLTEAGAISLGKILRHVQDTEGTILCNTALRSLDLQDNFLMDEGVTALAQSLTPPEGADQQPCKHGLRELWLGGNSIGLYGVEALLHMITAPGSTVQLDKLGLGHNQLDDSAAEAIAAALYPIEETEGSWSFPLIAKAMNLWGNKITDDGAEAMAEAILPRPCRDGSLAINMTLMSLNIFRNNISEKGKAVLRSAVEELNALRPKDCQMTLLV